uniref:uncharacterized protein LOC120329891 n=1 Tax=Styela clava TaxID=7725 RepID=UPI00193A8BA2|nr:uncharacterized protein LOC120329891 [Styela clava]
MVAELPSGDFTILCIAALLCIVFMICCFLAFNNDKDEIHAVTDIIYFQEKIPPRDPIYIVTLKFDDSYVYSGQTDLILRLRGSNKDSPLVLFRDYDGFYIAREKTLSLGVSIPFDLGSVVEIDVAGDNSDFDEGMSVFSFSDLFIRKLPRKADALANSKTRMMLENQESPFEALSKNVRTWTSVETLTTAKGVGVLGVSAPETGHSSTVRARDVATSLPLQEETVTLKKKAWIGFRPLHYILSQASSWHEPWSEYSQLDHTMVMCLDMIATLVVVSSSYAYGIEKFLSVTAITPMLKSLSDNTPGAVNTIEKFDMMDMFKNFSRYIVPMIQIVYITFITSSFIIPLSLLWCRLFRLIGGKGFEKALEDAQPPYSVDIASKSKAALHFGYSGAPHISARSKPRSIKIETPHESARHSIQGTKAPKVSAGLDDQEDLWEDNFGHGTTLMLRTLECKSTHTASCVTSSRRLRMEPLLSNCPADHITARSIAYVRTKMANLRDETILSGQSGLKHPDVLHESHTQSTDAPQMPPPTSTPDGSGDVLRVSRYCERLVQQAERHIRDNSVIAECFEVSPHLGAADVPGKKPDKFANCCPRKCCREVGNPDQSISNLTFFTEEDAISLQEMVEHLPAASNNNQKSPWPPAGAADSGLQLINNGDSETYYEPPPTPCPSAKPKKSSLKKFSIKNIRESVTKKTYVNKRESEDSSETGKCKKGRGLKMTIPKKRSSSAPSRAKHYEPESGVQRKKGVRFEDEREKKAFLRKKRSRSNESKTKQHEGKQSADYKDNDSVKELVKKFNRRTKKPGSPSSPFPSARSDVFYDAVAETVDDWTSAKSHVMMDPHVDEPLPDTAPFKGNTVKICVFIFLLILQLGEIYFVTAYKMEENKFFILEIDGSPGQGVSRMHAAFISCILAVLWYPIFTVHVIALASYLIENIRSQLSEEKEPYYETGSVASKHSLSALP